MVLFYNMLDVAGVAAFVIWISLNPDWSLNDRRWRRRKFLKQLVQELIDDYIQVRLQNPRILQQMWEMHWSWLESLQFLLDQHQKQNTSLGSVAGYAQHELTRKLLQYAIFATGMWDKLTLCHVHLIKHIGGDCVYYFHTINLVTMFMVDSLQWSRSVLRPCTLLPPYLSGYLFLFYPHHNISQHYHSTVAG